MNTEPKVCQECGTELTADSPQGLCPKCLLKQGLESQAPGSSSIDEEKTAVDLEARHSSAGVLPREGQRFGNYRLIRLLGQGGMGAVYEAEHLPSIRRVALKVLNHALDSPEARQRFLREGQLAASVNHPNSVYVFGTEEIDGIPVISMELLPGGTLKDRVQQNGPLPVTEAVDAILHVIAGLEAAQARGVLHRDVKPANCFFDADGTVKVGDFGLSISTLARGDPGLTASGAFMGTPAFASPEQIRGDELDVRADIYSVGVTLYYLLTSRTPFEGNDVASILAMVLEREPDAPSKLRPEIPKGLAQVVLHCIEKPRANRYQAYGEIRNALLPFSSTAAAPATLGLRFLAGVFDFLILNGTLRILETFIDFLRFFSPGLFFWAVLYFAVFECIWGASPGKLLCRLRVVGFSRNVVGAPKILLRAFLYGILLQSPLWLHSMMKVFSPALGVELLTPFLSLLLFPLLFVSFVTARRHNGFAGLHDLLTRTRVVGRSVHLARPVSHSDDDDRPLLPTAGTVQLGPYQLLGKVSVPSPKGEQQGRVPAHATRAAIQTGASSSRFPAHSSQLLLGYDPLLLRKVWIRTMPQGEPPLPSALRDLGRAGRLRWLSGSRTAQASWDAYEGLSGTPLLNLLGKPQPWGTVRYWLCDLAEELNAGSKDQSLPLVLALDRVWITADGRATLLDFPVPGVGERDPSTQEPEALSVETERLAAFSASDAHLFLNQAALSALEGHLVDAGEARSRTLAEVPLPLYARTLLQDLPASQISNRWVNQLKSLLSKPPAVSRSRRLGVIGACVLFVALMTVGSLRSGGLFEMHRSMQDYENLEPLRYCLQHHDSLRPQKPRLDHIPFWVRSRLESSDVLQNVGKPASDPQAEERRDVEIYAAVHFRKTISDTTVWRSEFAKRYLTEHQRQLAERIAAVHPGPSEDELKVATARLKPFLDNCQPKLTRETPRSSFNLWVAPFLIEGNWFLLAILSLLWTTLLLGGLFVRMFGIAIVAKDGAKASWPRVLGRTLITWSPILVIHNVLHQPAAAWLIPLALALFAAGVAGAFLRPERGLQDRIAGTWLVPR